MNLFGDNKNSRLLAPSLWELLEGAQGSLAPSMALVSD